MTRYVNKPHGLTIASGNVFFFGHGEALREFPAMIRFNAYDLGENVPFSSINGLLQTPAIQICWFQEEVPLPVTGSRGSDYAYYWRPRRWFRTWLDKHAPGWAVRPVEARGSGEKLIFLQKRQHAVAIANLVQEHLGPIPSRVDFSKA